jgi:hypothetical protein
MLYKQCKLSLDNDQTTGWIEERGAKVGSCVVWMFALVLTAINTLIDVLDYC